MDDKILKAALAGLWHEMSASGQLFENDQQLTDLIVLANYLAIGEWVDVSNPKVVSSQVVSIFDRVSLGRHQIQAEHFLPQGSLSLSALGQYIASDKHADATVKDRADDWRSVRVEIKPTYEGDRHTYIENALADMQHLTWSVPSAFYPTTPDVSLYDHSRMTAALAVCLQELGEGKITELLNAVARNFRNEPAANDKALLETKVALLIGGDISGVQDFIYTLTSKKAAQTLRGRSFYLQLLTEAILRFVLRELDLPYTNIIYSGGGHFYLLAPLRAKYKLLDIQKYITETLLAHHGTALYLALGQAEVPASGFKIGQFPTFWNGMHGALAKAKQQRYMELGEATFYEKVFKPQAHGGNRENTCSVCGEERDRTIAIEGDDEEGRICPLCLSFSEQIGKKLPEADFVLLGLRKTQPDNPIKGDAFDILRAFGLDVSFNPDHQFSSEVERVVVWALSDSTKSIVAQGKPTAQVTRYTVNKVPRITFDELQDKSRGFARLGVLRMDVDNLGDVFKDGFTVRDDQGAVVNNGNGSPRSIATLARISALSFQMSLFFEGWVKRLCEQEEYDNLIYAVYAGGDDVFLIGPWDKMPSLASQIASDFKRYVGGNPDVHLSGGLAFIGGKYPVYQAAEDAHDVLESAKHLDGKDGFGFLGETWKWVEFAAVTEKFERLRQIVQDKNTLGEESGLGGPQALLQILRRLGKDESERYDTDKKKRRVSLAKLYDKPKERAAEKAKPIRPLWGPWMWQGAYRLKRMAEHYKNDEKLSKALESIHKELSGNNYDNIRQWGTAARWAQLWLREK